MDIQSIEIREVGPREGFQFEGMTDPFRITTDDKIKLITALTETGVRNIDAASFVSPKAVPQMGDAEEIAARLPIVDGVEYSALYLNDKGLQRAIAANRFAITGLIMFTASETFSRINQHRDHEQDREMQRELCSVYRSHGIAIDRASIMAAFGCNYEGDVPTERILQYIRELRELCEEADSKLRSLHLADTMGWGDPELVKRTIGAIRDEWPDLEISLHLHDTRGTGIANVYAAMEVGVRKFDTSVGGLGGCPFAKVAAGNVSTEDVVFMCDRMEIKTGIDLKEMVSCARLAEEIVGHPLQSRLMATGVGLVSVE